MKNIMIDIETLGTEPDSAILSIAAVNFNLTESLYLKIIPESNNDYGRTINISTVKWWFKQSDEARNEFLQGNFFDLKHALLQLHNFIKPDDIVWANSPSFDCVILKSAFKAVTIECPWKFYNERDVRTLLGLKPGFGGRVVTHNALDDCMNQIEKCKTVMRELGL